jgi:hypothetical protein
MSKLFINALVFGIAFQLTCYLMWSFNVFGGLVQYPLGTAPDLNNLNNMFSIDLWSGLIGATGVVTGIAMLLLRQGTYALYALLIFALGIFFNIIKGFLIAIPNTIAGIVSMSGLSSAIMGPIATVIGVICVFGGFMYFFGLVIQRDPM